MMHPPSLVLFAFCLLVSFLYAGIEAGLLSLNRRQLRGRVHRGDPAAVRLDRLLAHPARLLATVLLVTNFADVGALVLITNALVRRFGPWGCALAGILMLPVYLLGLQVLPKLLFRQFPLRALSALAGLLGWTSWVLAPVMALSAWAGRRSGLAGVVRAEDGSHRRTSLFLAREEFKTLVADGEKSGAISAVERRMINNVIDFSLTPVRQLMQAPPEVFHARPGCTVGELMADALGRQLALLPVATSGGAASPTALVDVFTLLFERDPMREAAVYLRRPPLTVRPEDTALRVLRRLRAARLPAAAVIAKDGQFVGIVRTADLANRLVKQPAEVAAERSTTL